MTIAVLYGRIFLFNRIKETNILSIFSQISKYKKKRNLAMLYNFLFLIFTRICANSLKVSQALDSTKLLPQNNLCTSKKRDIYESATYVASSALQ